jgi:hypothetical protein
MPATTHVCPKCSEENPCFFSEGEIVSLREQPADEQLALWTGIVLEVDRDKEGRVYRVMWGAPAMNPGTSGAYAARHSGQHRREELQRFLVPLLGFQTELRGGGGGAEGITHRFGPPVP